MNRIRAEHQRVESRPVRQNLPKGNYYDLVQAKLFKNLALLTSNRLRKRLNYIS